MVKLLSSAVHGMLTSMVWAMIPVCMTDIRKAWIMVDSIWGKRHNVPWLFIFS